MLPPPLSSILLSLAQISEKALAPDDPRLPGNSSSILTLLLGALLVVAILLIAFKVSKRNQVQE